MGTFFSMARAMATRYCSPPERYTPLVPMTVWMPAGNFSTISMHCAAFSTASTSAFGGLRPTQTDVVQKATLEQAAVLEYKGDGVHQLFLGDVPHIRSAHPDAAALHIKEPADKVCQRRFSAAGRTYKSHSLSRLNLQRNALDDLVFPS